MVGAGSAVAPVMPVSITVAVVLVATVIFSIWLGFFIGQGTLRRYHHTVGRLQAVSRQLHVVEEKLNDLQDSINQIHKIC